ncbi:DUF1559 domain-containing protein [Bremerella cremea]|uniref:DUF1559 domain-containing protein n=1 Tax=Bremerella cremea TaxID=1031537 RepID=UPI0031F1B79D
MKRNGFTLVELLVVIAIIGVLIALLLPAVQQAREAARRIQCTNNLKQLSLSLHNYHDTVGTFPPGWIYFQEGRGANTLGRASWGWGSFLLPYIEQNALYDQLQVGTVGLGVANFDLTQTLLPAYVCPSDNPDPIVVNGGFRFGASNYSGVLGRYDTAQSGAAWSPALSSSSNPFYGRTDSQMATYQFEGVLGPGRGIRFADITDGTSNTLAIGEKSQLHGNQMGVWAGTRLDKCANCSTGAVFAITGVVDFAINEDGGNNGFQEERVFTSRHPGGAIFALSDGSTTFLPETIDMTTYLRLGQRNDGQVVGNY